MYYAIYRVYGKLNRIETENWDEVASLPDVVDLIKSDSLTSSDFKDMFSLMKALDKK